MNETIEKKFSYSKYLKSYSYDEIDSIYKRANNIIVNSRKELIDYVLEALDDPDSNKNLYLGIIPNETIKRIKTEIKNIKKNKINQLFKSEINYALVINQEEIRHMKKDSLTKKDIISFINIIDYLVVKFDTVSYSLYGNQNALRFKKRINENTYIALEVISNKYHTLRTQTLFLDKIDFEKRKKNLSPTFDELKNSPNTHP